MNRWEERISMILAHNSRRPRPEVGALLDALRIPPGTLNLDVHAEDEMFQGARSVVFGLPGLATTGYLRAGAHLMSVVRQVAQYRFAGLSNVSAFLDFACGYGRFTRFLVREIAPHRVWASDIHANGVTFVRDQLGTNGFVSVVDPENLRVEQRFDMIFAASLFSHLPERSFTRWLRRLLNLLTPRGVLLFSVMDEMVMSPSLAMPKDGLLYFEASESPTLDTRDYGLTYVTEAFVKRAIETASAGRACYRRIPRILGYLQDLYVVGEGGSDFVSLPFQHGPQGFLDICEPAGRRGLALSGWAADVTPGAHVADVQALVNGELRAQCTPSLMREDVAKYLRDARHLRSGYTFQADFDRRMRRSKDVMVVRAVSSSGLENVLHASTVHEAMVFLRMQKEKLSRERGNQRADSPGLSARLREHYARGGVRAVMERVPGFIARRFSGRHGRPA